MGDKIRRFVVIETETEIKLYPLGENDKIIPERTLRAIYEMAKPLNIAQTYGYFELTKEKPL